MKGKVLYRTWNIVVTTEGVWLNYYYFPIPLPKFLGWSAIKRIVVGPRRAKTWGQSLSPVWWHLQAGRECAERTAIILDVADQPNYFLSPSSGMTPPEQDVEKIVEIIASRCSAPLVREGIRTGAWS